MQDVDQRLTRDVDRLCTDLAELIPTMVCASSYLFASPGSAIFAGLSHPVRLWGSMDVKQAVTEDLAVHLCSCFC